MKAGLIEATPFINVCRAAKLCYTGEFGFKAEQDPVAFAKALHKKGHSSPLEFAWAMLYIEGLSSVALAQITRHRLFSFMCQSHRYTEAQGLMLPEGLKEKEGVTTLLAESRALYEKLIAEGVRKEDARYILPRASSYNLLVAGNLREWLHFFSLRREEAGAQKEICDIAEACRAALPKDWREFIDEVI